MREMPPELLEQVEANPRIRRALAHEDPLWFALIYLRHHFTSPIAPFHLEMFHLMQQTDHDFIVVMAFRESGKSTVMNMANTLWSILGNPEKKFVVIVSQTQEQTKSHFATIKAELETNDLLKNEFGPFAEGKDEWNKMSLALTYHGSKILSIYREQAVRGLKYGQFRPDLIICDDIEDAVSAADKEGRNTVYDHFQNEVLPLGSKNTRIVVLGNLLSRDSFIMRLKDDIDTGSMDGIFRAYPLLDDRGKSLWPERYSGSKGLKKLRRKFSEDTWGREYLLTLGVPRYYSEPRGAPPGPFRDLLDEYEGKLQKALADLSDRFADCLRVSGPQTPLIRQMKKFTISAPTNGFIAVPESGDPRYEKYQQYLEKRQTISKETAREFEERVYKLAGEDSDM